MGRRGLFSHETSRRCRSYRAMSAANCSSPGGEQAQLAEMQERLDFAERLLTAGRASQDEKGK